MKEISQNNSKMKLLVKAILFCATFTVLFIAFSFFKSLIPDKFERLTHGAFGTIAAILTTFLFLMFDRKTFADIGLIYQKTTPKYFFVGLLIGMGLMGLLTSIVTLTSGFKVETNTKSSFANFILWTLPLIPLAYMEEVGFRGYPLSILKKNFGIRYSILITSLLFAFYHIANGWTIQSSFSGAGVWGIIFGLAAIYSNGLSIPTGLHYGVNLTTAAFGISENSFNMWILKQSNGQTLENYQSSQMATLIPQISIFIIAIIFMELYLRKKNYR